MRRDGADLVLLHGFTQTGRSWQPIAHALAGRYRATAPDLPGHGDFAERRPGLVRRLRRVPARAGRRPAVTLAGYSMGGRIALHAALSLGRAGRRLVLIGASPGLADPAERAARAADDAALADRIEAIGIDAFVREWGAQPLFAGMPRGVADLVDADRRRNTAAGLAAALRGLGTGVMPPLWDRLGELAIPVDLVVGERDEKFRAIAERMAAALPAARLRGGRGRGTPCIWRRRRRSWSCSGGSGVPQSRGRVRSGAGVCPARRMRAAGIEGEGAECLRAHVWRASHALRRRSIRGALSPDSELRRPT